MHHTLEYQLLVGAAIEWHSGLSAISIEVSIEIAH